MFQKSLCRIRICHTQQSSKTDVTKPNTKEEHNLYHTNSHHNLLSLHICTRLSSNQEQLVTNTYTQPSLLIRLRCMLNLLRMNEWRTMNQSRKSRRRCDSLIRCKSARFCIVATLLKRNGPTHGTPNAILPKGREKKSKLLTFSNPVPTRETAINTVSGVWSAGPEKVPLRDDRARKLHDWLFSKNRTCRITSFKTIPKRSPRHALRQRNTVSWQHTQ